MNNNNIFVQEYLSTLKEDSELDYLFPLLLKSMGYKIIRTPKESKGQSQYGKDVIAIGPDEFGVIHKWYFELKGYDDKNITESNFHKKDGILESLREAKYVDYEDYSIPSLSDLPTKIVLVHNGIIKSNFLQTFNGFVKKELEGYGFERWDIYKLSDLFSTYLFGEYLLVDVESNLLLKKAFAFWDLEDYDFNHLKELITLQFSKQTGESNRPIKKLFASLGLINTLIQHYSIVNNNLVPAKECSKFLILKSWHWILENDLQEKKPIVNEFKKLLKGQFEIFNKYFKKTFRVAKIENGLFSEFGFFYEVIGYPIRCFEYIDDLIYYCRLRNTIFESKKLERIKNKQKDLIIELIESNSGFNRPVFDNHSIPIVQLFLFFSDETCLRKKDVNFLFSYIDNTVSNLKIEKLKHNRQPELYGNINSLIEFVATGNKPNNYFDNSSILLAILLEITTIFNSEKQFIKILSFIDENLSLQIVSIDFDKYNVEHLLFEKHLHDEYYVDCIERIQDSLKLLKNEANFKDFKKSILEKSKSPNSFKTDSLGLSCIRYLAHSYFKNEIFPEEWRGLLKEK
jgi:hypothetical protein